MDQLVLHYNYVSSFAWPYVHLTIYFKKNFCPRHVCMSCQWLDVLCCYCCYGGPSIKEGRDSTLCLCWLHLSENLHNCAILSAIIMGLAPFNIVVQQTQCFLNLTATKVQQVANGKCVQRMVYCLHFEALALQSWELAVVFMWHSTSML